MPVVHVTVHPRGLHPLEAARAYRLHEEEGLSLDSVCDEVRNMEGNRPSKKAVWTAVRQVKALEGNAVPQGNYDNCGRKRMPTAGDERPSSSSSRSGAASASAPASTSRRP